MAWRPYDNFIEGELDNTTLGKVTGWMTFYRHGKKPLTVYLDLGGDFHEDIRGCKIHLTNLRSQERNDLLERRGSYMDGFAQQQVGQAGDMTAGLLVNGAYPYTPYPYIEWYSEANGRVVLELAPEQIAIVDDRRASTPPLTEEERQSAEAARQQRFVEEVVKLSELAQKSSGKRVIPIVISVAPQSK